MFMIPGESLETHDISYKNGDKKDIAKLQTHFSLDYEIYTTNS